MKHKVTDSYFMGLDDFKELIVCSDRIKEILEP